MPQHNISVFKSFLLVVFAATATTFGYDKWLNLSTVNVNAVIWGGTQWVSVGDDGLIQTSTDGTTWARQASGTSDTLLAVNKSGGQYVAVGMNGAILTSSNTTEWTTRNSGGVALRGVAGSGSQYVAVGDSGRILSSSNGITWTRRTSGTTDPWYTVIWDGNRFLAMGGAAFNSRYATSTDGITWSSTAFALARPYALAWSGSLYVAVGIQGRVLTSSNGTSWTLVNGIYNISPSDLRGVVWTGTQFVAVNLAGKAFTSPDGATWTERTSNSTASQYLRALGWNGSSMVARGTSGNQISSTTGDAWTNTSTLTETKIFAGVVWGNNRFVMTGDSGTSRISTDGKAWTTYSSGMNGMIAGVTWTGTRFVGVTDSGVIGTSPDGITWTQRTAPEKYKLYDVAYGNNVVVATGATNVFGAPSVIISSLDGGVTWTRRTTDNGTTLPGIAYGAGMFVAVGADASIFSSPDGITWTRRGTTILSTLYYSVTWAGDKFILTGTGGSISTSPDGITWTTRTSGITETIRRITWTGTLAIAVGDGGKILTSPDGITWTSRTSGITQRLKAVYAGPSSVVVTGVSGTVLAADRTIPNISFTSPQALASGQSGSLPPSNSGSAATAWTITPALPTGLSINTSNGTISGSHSGETAVAAYTVIAKNAFDADTTVVNLAIQEPLASITYSSPNSTLYSLGEGITMNRATVSGGTIGRTLELQSGTLPPGIGFNPANGNIYGTPTQTGTFPVTVRASNLLGSVTSNLTLVVRDPVPAISYAPGSFAYPLNTAITTLAPANTGGEVRRWSITPDLTEKTGLLFNTTTGKISGTPSKISTDTLFTVTAVGLRETYTHSTPLSIRITPVAPTVSYADAPVVLSLGAEALLQKTGRTGIITAYAISPALPAGLLFSPITGAVSGVPTAASPATNYIVTVTGPGGTGADTINLAITTPAPTVRYADTTLSWKVGVAITPFSKSSMSGKISSYSVSPALPSGLTFNTTTGQVAGTPTVAVAAADYIMTAIGPGGTGSDTVSIATFVDAPIIAFGTDTVRLVRGAEITPFRPVNTGGTINSWAISVGSNGKSLTANTGLLFNPTTGKILGTPVYLSAPVSYTVTAFGLSGSQSQSSVVVAITAPLSKPVAGASEAVSFRVTGRVGSMYSLRIPLAFGTAERVTVSVVDLSGRAVWSRNVDLRAADAGGRDLVWDGRSADGRSVAAGMYVLRASALKDGVHKRLADRGLVLDP